jgi:predicted transcriptional regulator
MLEKRTKFSKMLDKYLKERKIKKGMFSGRLGISRTTLYDYEMGKRELPVHMKKAIMYETNSVINFPEAK